MWLRADQVLQKIDELEDRETGFNRNETEKKMKKNKQK